MLFITVILNKLFIFLLHRIRNVPSSIFMIPQLSYNCTLYGLKPSTTSGWSNEACLLFRDLMTENTGTFFMYPMETNRERIEVDIVWNEYFYPLSIRDAMFFLGHGSSEEDYTNKALVKFTIFFNKICIIENLITNSYIFSTKNL